MADEITLDDLGVPARSTAVLDAAHVARIAATLDADAPGDGDVLPSLWHWAFFTPTTPTAGLGPDGHPRLASPAMAPFPRRMWGAGRLEWDHDLRVGATAERVSAVRSARTTTGASGTLLLVVVEPRVPPGRRALRPRAADARLPRPAGRAGAAAGRRRRRRGARRRVVDAAPTRADAAVPLLGDHVQHPPHPLRPAVRPRRRGLPGPRRAGPADGDDGGRVRRAARPVGAWRRTSSRRRRRCSPASARRSSWRHRPPTAPARRRCCATTAPSPCASTTRLRDR